MSSSDSEARLYVSDMTVCDPFIQEMAKDSPRTLGLLVSSDRFSLERFTDITAQGVVDGVSRALYRAMEGQADINHTLAVHNSWVLSPHRVARAEHWKTIDMLPVMAAAKTSSVAAYLLSFAPVAQMPRPKVIVKSDLL